MRASTLLNQILDGYRSKKSVCNLDRASDLARNEMIRGGWEIWLQLEIAYCLLNKMTSYTLCEREREYPHDTRKCDFYLHRESGIQDDTYFELKCINSHIDQSSSRNYDPRQDVLRRFFKDVDKQKSVMENCQRQKTVINCVSMIATFCVFDQQDFKRENDTSSPIYVLDKEKNKVTDIGNVDRDKTPRLFLVAKAI